MSSVIAAPHERTAPAMGSIVCVSIGRSRHKNMLAEHQNMVAAGAKLCELRVDYVPRNLNIRRLIKERPGPVILTCRREKDGGRFKGSEKERLLALRTAIAEGVEYVDLEEDAAREIPRYGSTKRIVSYHNFRETPDNLEEIHKRLAACDADIVKIATMAQTTGDNVRMMRLLKNATVPTVAFCMGEIGTPTRLLGAKFGSPFTYATFNPERTMAPGQLSFHDTIHKYHYERINAQTQVFGVIADPVAHSYSPLIHNTLFQKLGINAVYLPFRVPHADLETFITDCTELGIRGLSVTIPHKEEVLKLAVTASDVVREIGAANTLIFSKTETKAYNTDYRAAMDCIEKAFPHEDRYTSMLGRRVLLLGAGGVARAIGYGVKRRSGDIVVTARSLPKAEELAARLGGRAVAWELRHSVRCDMIINCTPVGMHPNMDESPFDGRYFKEGQFVFDTIYNPEQTLFVKQARQNRCHVITGVDMFIGQAALQFRYFTGQMPPVDQMRMTLKRAMSAARYDDEDEQNTPPPSVTPTPAEN
jgi:3-dehydroquinate dehydratase/shikimate dehydrogenase